VIIPTPAESGSSCNMYSKHIVISLVSGFISVFPIFIPASGVRLIAPVARVLCLQLLHLLHSQLELFVLALLVRVSLVLHMVSFWAEQASFQAP